MIDRKKIIETAAAENGYKESPPSSNNNKFGEWYGMNHVAWCAIFVSWVYDQCGVKWPKRVESEKGFAWCPALYYRAKQNDRITLSPKAGDIVLFDWNGDQKADHTGLFSEWIVEGKTFRSWEGNTSPSNNSNGGEVMLRERKVSQVQAFVNVIDV
jgi:hypothetical protein